MTRTAVRRVAAIGALALLVLAPSDDVAEYDVTQYGPAFGLNLHWGRR